MTYRELLLSLTKLNDAELDMEVIVSLGNDEDEISSVENMGRIENLNKACEKFELTLGTPYLRIT